MDIVDAAICRKMLGFDINERTIIHLVDCVLYYSKMCLCRMPNDLCFSVLHNEHERAVRVRVIT